MILVGGALVASGVVPFVEGLDAESKDGVTVSLELSVGKVSLLADFLAYITFDAMYLGGQLRESLTY